MYQRLLMSMKRKLKTSVNLSWLVIEGSVDILRGGGQTDRQSGITGRGFIYRCRSGQTEMSCCYHTSCLAKQHIPPVSSDFRWHPHPPHPTPPAAVCRRMMMCRCATPHACKRDVYELSRCVRFIHGGCKVNFYGLTRHQTAASHLTHVVCDRAT